MWDELGYGPAPRIGSGTVARVVYKALTAEEELNFFDLMQNNGIAFLEREGSYCLYNPTPTRLHTLSVMPRVLEACLQMRAREQAIDGVYCSGLDERLTLRRMKHVHSSLDRVWW